MINEIEQQRINFERQKTILLALMVALALALVERRLPSPKGIPTGDKTNLISTKVNQLDSFFSANSLLLFAFVHSAEQQKEQLIGASL